MLEFFGLWDVLLLVVIVCFGQVVIITLIVILMLGVKHVIVLVLVVCALLYTGYVEFLIVEFNDVVSSIITV